jgi:hypothetical protein
MDLNVKFEEFVEKLNSMGSSEFDDMLIRCGIDRIKPSIESDYVSCMRKSFSKKNEEYSVVPNFKSDGNINNDFNLENDEGAA